MGQPVRIHFAACRLEYEQQAGPIRIAAIWLAAMDRVAMVDQCAAASHSAANFLTRICRQLDKPHRIAFHAAGAMRQISKFVTSFDIAHAAVVERGCRAADTRS